MKRLFALSLFLIAFAGTVTAQTAEDVLRAHIEAVGGEEAWSSVENAHTKVSISVEMQMGVIVLEAETWNVYPGYLYAQQNLISAPDGIPDISSTVYVSPDEAWVDNFQGRQDISENVAAALGGNMANLGHALQELELLTSMDAVPVTLEGQTELNGKQAHVISVGGPVPSTRYYDVESGLLIATEANSPMGQVRMNMSEYADFGGLKVAIIQEGTTAMGAQTVAITAFETGLNLNAEKLAQMARGED